MSEIILRNVALSYPIYDLDARSLKKDLFQIATGGKFVNTSRHALQISALNDISFHLKRGDRLCLIGHNGAGKSTLLKLLAGVYEPHHGYVHIRGNVSSLINVGVGMQHNLTGYENIKMRGLILGLSKAKIQELIKDVEEFTELGNFLSMPIKTYSSGMIIRLGFAISTALEPDILLVDEVIGTGDSRFIEKAKRRMREFVDRSNILVFSSHKKSLVREFCDKAIWLEHGKIRGTGDVDSVLEQYESQTS